MQFRLVPQNVVPDSTTSCGPYQPAEDGDNDKVKVKGHLPPSQPSQQVDRDHHDTLSLIAVDEDGNIAAGTTTNGATNKIPG